MDTVGVMDGKRDIGFGGERRLQAKVALLKHYELQAKREKATAAVSAKSAAAVKGFALKQELKLK